MIVHIYNFNVFAAEMMTDLYLRFLQLIFIALMFTIIYAAPHTKNRCEAKKNRNGCFDERIEKSPNKLKHMIQLKSNNDPGVSIIQITYCLHVHSHHRLNGMCE